jgi:predicted Zn-dependent protease
VEVARRLILVVMLCAAAGLAQTPVNTDLREGIALTTKGQFEQAIPHFLTARDRGVKSFALEFNLALCYVGVRRFPDAIGILTAISPGARAADVKELLAQAYVGDRQAEPAWKTFQEAAVLAPDRERLYLLVSQACLEEGLTDLAGRVLETALRNLPGSPRLHFERGILFSQQDDNAQAIREFQQAQERSPGSEIAYIAATEQALIEGRMQEAIASARAGIRAGYTHYLLLTMLGETLLRGGAAPAAPEFAEARAALEQAIAKRPSYPSSHISLGRVYLALGRNGDAIAQLEEGRRLDPRNKAVYPPLAAAYQRSSMPDKAKQALAALAALNREDAARIGAADGGHAGYVKGGR